MSVQALTQFDPKQFFYLPPANSAGTQRLDTRVGGIAVSNDFSGRLSVTTAEGDTITLSANLESDFRTVNYKSHAEGDGKTADVEARYAEYSLKQEFGVTVEGDLNDQEIKDLSKLFRKVANIFKKFLSGQDDEALAKTAKLGSSFGNYSSLADLSLNVDLERSVTVFAAELTGEVTGQPDKQAALPLPAPPATPSEASTTQAATPGAAPSTDTAIPSPSSDTTFPVTMPTASTTEAVTPGESPLTAAAIPSPSTGITAPTQDAAIVQQVLDAIQDAGVELRKLNKYFPQFLEGLRKAFRNGKQDERQAEGSQTNQTPIAPAQTVSAAFLAYQSTRQTSVSLSILS
jgi:hypothetical protein